MTGTLWVGGGGTLLEDSDPWPARPSDRSSMKLHLIARNEDRGVLGSWLMLNNSELGFWAWGLIWCVSNGKGSTRGAYGNNLGLGNHRRSDLKTGGNQGNLCSWCFPNVCAAACILNIVCNVQRVVATSQKTQNAFVTQTNLLMLSGEDVVAA